MAIHSARRAFRALLAACLGLFAATSMKRALENAGTTVELVTLRDEDHWFSTSAGKIELLRSLQGFLASHLL